MTKIVPVLTTKSPFPTDEAGIWRTTMGVYRTPPSVALTVFTELASATKVTTVAPPNRGFFNAEKPNAAPIDTMSLEEIRAAESLGMDGVVGLQQEARVYGEPSKSYYPSDISDGERRAMMNGMAYRTQGFDCK